MKIQFSKDTEYGVFSDALNLPDDHGMTDEQIETLKQERVTAWITVITTPTPEPIPEEILPEETPPEESPLVEVV